MIPDEDDHDLLRAWQQQAHEAPGELLDRRILTAARMHRARRQLLPLAAALAACLMLAIYAGRWMQTPQPPRAAPLDTSTFGLYVGRVGLPPDPETQAMMRQVPGATSSAAVSR